MNNGNPSRLYVNCLDYLCNHFDQVCLYKALASVCPIADAGGGGIAQHGFHVHVPAPASASLALAAAASISPASINVLASASVNGAAGPKTHSRKNSSAPLRVYQFKDDSVKFNHVISQDLLEHLCELGKLNDQTFGLFNSRQTCLKSVHIKNACLSKEVVQSILKQHQIVELVFSNVASPSHSSSAAGGVNDAENNSITINDLIQSLNDWSLEHLRYLNVSRNASLFGSILINTKRLVNLQKLNVSYTCFNNLSLDIITQDLCNLEFLDISGTRVSDLSSLLRLKDKLKYLYMYHIRASLNDDIVGQICCLEKLQQLDLSREISTRIFADMAVSNFDINLLLHDLAAAKLPDLKYLDISGRLDIDEEAIMQFMENYPKLKFLGLALTNACGFEIFTRPINLTTNSTQLSAAPSPMHESRSSPSLSNLISMQASLRSDLPGSSLNILQRQSRDLIVTGESTEAQIIASLKNYKTRQVYVQRALLNLYTSTKHLCETRLDLIQLVAEIIPLNLKSLSVQLAATTCIYNFTKLNLAIGIPNHAKIQIINLTVSLMQNFPNNIVLQKNCLMILSNELLLVNCHYNRFECIKTMLESLVTYPDLFIINSSIAVCLQALSNLNSKQKRMINCLAQPLYTQKILQLVNSKIQSASNDLIMNSLLEILSNLIENSNEWSCDYLTQNGLNIYINIIEAFKTDPEIIFRAINLIYNLSELPQIRPIIFNHAIINHIRLLLDHSEIKIVFLAVGFFANLLAFMPESSWDWNELFDEPVSKESFRHKLECIIDSWIEDWNIDIPFRHQTFGSLAELMKSSNEPLVQIWSILAVHNLCRVNSANYHQILSDENERLIKTMKNLISLSGDPNDGLCESNGCGSSQDSSGFSECCDNLNMSREASPTSKVKKVCAYALQVMQNSAIVHSHSA